MTDPTPMFDQVLNFDDLKKVLDEYENNPSLMESNQQVLVNLHVIREVLQICYLVKFLRKEISSAGNHLQQDCLVHAHLQLDAIVQATADATHKILDHAECIQSLISQEKDKPVNTILDTVNNHIMEIYESCSFQDITGQRIGRVVKVLKVIEEKLWSLADTFGLPDDEQSSASHKTEDTNNDFSDSSLMNGPQLPGSGQDQSSVDELMGKS